MTVYTAPLLFTRSVYAAHAAPVSLNSQTAIISLICYFFHFPLRFVCPDGGDTELLGWTHCGSEHQTQLLWSAARRATHHNSCCSTGSSVDSSIPFPHINRSHLQCFVCVSESDKRLKLTGFEALSDEISQNFFNTFLSSRDFKQVV